MLRAFSIFLIPDTPMETDANQPDGDGWQVVQRSKKR